MKLEKIITGVLLTTSLMANVSCSKPRQDANFIREKVKQNPSATYTIYPSGEKVYVKLGSGFKIERGESFTKYKIWNPAEKNTREYFFYDKDTQGSLDTMIATKTPTKNYEEAFIDLEGLSTINRREMEVKKDLVKIKQRAVGPTAENTRTIYDIKNKKMLIYDMESGKIIEGKNNLQDIFEKNILKRFKKEL